MGATNDEKRVTIQIRGWLLVAFVSLPIAAAAAVVGNPVWFDDFLGATIDPRYVTFAYGGSVSIGTGEAHSVNGQLLLTTLPTQQGMPRIRLGGDSGSSDPVDVRNWNASKNLIYESRVLYNATTYLQSSVGLVGIDDPKNYLEWYYAALSDKAGTWGLGIANATTGKISWITTKFVHEPQAWVVLRIETHGSPPKISGYINDKLMGTYSGPDVPTVNLVPEYNVYNYPVPGQKFSQPALSVDYLYVTQTR